MVTGYAAERGWQHKQKLVKGFTARYNATKMVYFEEYDNAYDAIAREKQLKGWRREKKEHLINGFNSDWKDVYHEAIR